MKVSAYATQGNLALESIPQRSPFTVIDGAGAAHPGARGTLFEASAHRDVHAMERPAAKAAYAGETRASQMASRLIAAAAIVVFTLAFLVIGSSALASQQAVLSADSISSTQEVRVKRGDSIWTIASEHPIEGYSTQSIVDAIYQINDLQESMLTPGMVVSVPTTSR